MSELIRDKGCLELALGHVKISGICFRICANVHNLLHNIIFTSVHPSTDRTAHTSNKTIATPIKNKVYAFKVHVQNSCKDQLLALSCVCMCIGCDWKFCRSL